MKKIVFMLMLFASIKLFAQTATYEQAVNKQVKGEISTYISQDGQTFNVGDTIIVGYPASGDIYSYIQQNAGVALYPLTNIASGSKVVIKRIRIQSKMVNVNTSHPVGYVYSLKVLNFDAALASGEISDVGYISSDQALQMLKNEKDKLDLGLITQEEYELRKSELVKFIK